jgi:ubiquinone biosynthesis monooxygenase Coq7
MHFLDKLIIDADKALRVVSGVVQASRPSPAQSLAEAAMSDAEKKHSAGLMRVNHVGEICAQALYDAQGRFSKTPEVKAQLAHAGIEEEDHLAWTAQRLHELGSHTSFLTPLWYVGSYTLGTLAALAGDKQSLGFVSETERQVEDHLTGHLQDLPVQDSKSRAVVEQMRVDEIAHGAAARALGGTEMPMPVKAGMKALSKVMTTVAYHI